MMKNSWLVAIRSKLIRGSARTLNIAYSAASTLSAGKLKEMAARSPKSFVLPSEEIRRKTAIKILHPIQHVTNETTKKTTKKTTKEIIPISRIEQIVQEGLKSGFLNMYGERIVINRHRIAELMKRLGIPAKKRESFEKKATTHLLMLDYREMDQSRGIFGGNHRCVVEERTGEISTYYERPYSVVTRDGKITELSRVVNQDKVQAGDNSPSVLLMPGIACHHGSFDLNDKDSYVLYLADRSRWVYLFDPRGQGINRGIFDQRCFFDTLVINDAPAALEFIYNRPRTPKPAVIIGHSMGGLIIESMLVRQALKLNRLADKAAELFGDREFSAKGKKLQQIERYLNKLETRLGSRRTDQEIRIVIAEARSHLERLKAVKGVVTLGSPKIFDKNAHPIFPLLLTLNIALPMMKEEKVPMEKLKELTRIFPSLLRTAHWLINPKNFDDPNAFLSQFIREGTDDFALGIGFQLQKAIYSGKGIKRMDEEKFNYSAHLDEIPPDIPIFHLYGTEDVLAGDYNLAFIKKEYYAGKALDFSPFKRYRHESNSIMRISERTDISRLHFEATKSQVTGILVEGVGHLDYLYGKVGEKLVRPLLDRIIETIWKA